MKLGGVRELRVAGGESGDSQVSVRERMSMSWSRIKFWRRAGLSIVDVMDEAEQMFKLANWSVNGPGLISMSPASSRTKEKMKLHGLEQVSVEGRFVEPEERMNEWTEFRDWQTDEGGKDE